MRNGTASALALLFVVSPLSAREDKITPGGARRGRRGSPASPGWRSAAKRLLVIQALAGLLLSCEETTRPEETPVGYFRVDSLFATFFVDKDPIGRIRTNLDMRYVCHFEKSPGYVQCHEVHSVIHDMDPRLCTNDPPLRGEDTMFDCMFGVWAYCDCSYLEETGITLTVEGWFEDCPYCDSGCARCRFVWSEDAVVRVEDRTDE